MFKTFLPTIQKKRIPKITGVQIEGSISSNYKYLAERSAIHDQIRWFEVEKEPGIYSWPQSLLLDYELVKDRRPSFCVKGCPEWARVNPLRCSPPDEAHYKSYADFIIAVIEKFNAPAVEIWNEPDTPYDLIAPGHDYYYGCWINLEAVFASGLRYGQMLEAIYPVIKDAHPEVTIIAGALSMNRDYSEKFIDAFCHVGKNYDAISFHAYPYHNGTEDWDVIGRSVERIRRSDYDTPLWVTETSLLWWGDSTPTQEYEDDQASYFEWVLGRCRELGIDAVYWYDLHNTWNHCGLVESGRKKAAWAKYQAILG